MMAREKLSRREKAINKGMLYKSAHRALRATPMKLKKEETFVPNGTIKQFINASIKLDIKKIQRTKYY